MGARGARRWTRTAAIVFVGLTGLLALPAGAFAREFVIESATPLAAAQAASATGGYITGGIPQLGAYRIAAPAGSLRDLRAQPGVLVADTDGRNQLYGLPVTDPLAIGEWYLQRVQAGLAWGETLGDPAIKIAVVDSGVDYKNPEFALGGKVTLGPDFGEGDDDPMDTLGHGTAVASVAVATNDGTGMVGLCPRCSLIAVKVIEDGGTAATKFNTAQGIVWAADNGANVINLSLGSPENDPVERDAVAYAIAKGVVVVASAGNTPTPVENFPAADPGVIAVASATDANLLARSSSFGPWVDLAAPGTEMLAAGLNGTYGHANGTSFAAPVVAGIAGLLLSRVPSLAPDSVAADLVGSTQPLDLTTLGRVNAGRAMRLAVGKPLDPDPPVVLSFVSFALDSPTATAGRKLTATATIMSSETGQLVREGDIICEAYAGHFRVRLAKAAFSSSQATCRWAIPAFLAGKKLRALFEVVSNGSVGQRRFTLPIHAPPKGRR
jgi:thermitase